MPSPTDNTIGNASDQKSASGSRTNSRKRVSVSSRSESRIAEMPAGQGHEHVLQRRGMRAQVGQPEAIALEERQQRRNRETKLFRRQLEGAVVAAGRRHAVEGAQGFF